MRYYITIDNVRSIEWGLSLQESYLFSWMFSLPSWAKSSIIDDGIFYFASKVKACEELPMLSNKIDTMYRYYSSLEKKGLIVIKKIDNKDFIMLTEKAKQWNCYNPFQLGFKSEGSEIIPEILVNNSESSSENFTTDNIYNSNNINKEIITNSDDETAHSETEVSSLAAEPPVEYKLPEETMTATYEENGAYAINQSSQTDTDKSVIDTVTPIQQLYTETYMKVQENIAKKKTATTKNTCNFGKVKKPKSPSVNINNCDDSYESVQIAKMYNDNRGLLPAIVQFSETLSAEINGMIELYGFDVYYNALKLLLNDKSLQNSCLTYPYKTRHILLATDKIDRFAYLDSVKIKKQQEENEEFNEFLSIFSKETNTDLKFVSNDIKAEAREIYSNLTEEEKKKAADKVGYVFNDPPMMPPVNKYLSDKRFMLEKKERLLSYNR